jgi:hypothetical protein
MKKLQLISLLLLFISCSKDNTYKCYTTIDGLPSNHVNCVFEDAKKNIWAATDKGLGCLSNGKWSIMFLNIPFYSINADNKGLLWFGSELGVSSYDGKSWGHWLISGEIPVNNFDNKTPVISMCNKLVYTKWAKVNSQVHTKISQASISSIK